MRKAFRQMKAGLEFKKQWFKHLRMDGARPGAYSDTSCWFKSIGGVSTY
jgi:hypothetical protein